MNPFDEDDDDVDSRIEIDDDIDTSDDDDDEQQEAQDNELLTSYRRLLQENRKIKGDMTRLYKICNDSQEMHQEEVDTSVKLNRALSDTRMQCDSLEQKYYLLKAKYETLEKKHASQQNRASEISERYLLKMKHDSETTIRDLQSQIRSLKKDLATSKTQLEKVEATLSLSLQSIAIKSPSTSTSNPASSPSSSSLSSSDNHLKVVSPIMSFIGATSPVTGAPVSPLFQPRTNQSNGGGPKAPPSPGIPKIPGVSTYSPVISPRNVDRATGTTLDAQGSSDYQCAKSGSPFSKIPDSDDPLSGNQRIQNPESDDFTGRKTIDELRAKIDSLTAELAESRSKLALEINNRKKEEARASKLAEEVIFLQARVRRAGQNSNDEKANRPFPVRLDSYPINDASGHGDSEHDNAPLLSQKENDRTSFLSRFCSIL